MTLPLDIINIIVSYAWEYTDFLDWFYDKKIEFVFLKKFNEIKNVKNKINWTSLINPNVIHLFKNNFDRFKWVVISKNPTAIPFLKKNLDKPDWEMFCLNPTVFKDNKKKIKKTLLMLV